MFNPVDVFVVFPDETKDLNRAFSGRGGGVELHLIAACIGRIRTELEALALNKCLTDHFHQTKGNRVDFKVFHSFWKPRNLTEFQF